MGQFGEVVRVHCHAAGEPGVDQLAVAGLEIVEGERRLGTVESSFEAIHPGRQSVVGHVRTATARVRWAVRPVAPHGSVTSRGTTCSR